MGYAGSSEAWSTYVKYVLLYCKKYKTVIIDNLAGNPPNL